MGLQSDDIGPCLQAFPKLPQFEVLKFSSILIHTTSITSLIDKKNLVSSKLVKFIYSEKATKFCEILWLSQNMRTLPANFKNGGSSGIRNSRFETP